MREFESLSSIIRRKPTRSESIFGIKIKKRFNLIKPFIILLLLLTITNISGGSRSKAANYTVPQNDINNSTYDFNQVDTSEPGKIKLQNGNLGKWSGYNNYIEPPIQNGGDSDAVWGPGNSFFYATQWNITSYLMRYDVDTKKWDFLAAPPVAFGTGVTIAYDGQQSVYAFTGDNKPYFYRYDIIANSWTRLADAPGNVGNGARMIYVSTGNSIWASRGSLSASFYRYDIASGVWEAKAAFPGTSVDYGFDIAWNGSGRIYAISNHYYDLRYYDIASNSWSVRLTNNIFNNYGRYKLFWVPSQSKLYVVMTRWSGDFGLVQRYNPTTNAWDPYSTDDLAPVGQYQDWDQAALFDGNDTIYGLYGADIRSVFYKYSVSANKWDAPTYNIEPQTIFGATGGNVTVTSSSFFNRKVIYDGDHTIYYAAGYDPYSFPYFYKMDLITKQVTFLAYYPIDATYVGTAGVKKGNYVYVLAYYSSSYFFFYRLDVTTPGSDWQRLYDLPVYPSDGAELVDGDANSLWYISGAGRNTIYKLNLSVDANLIYGSSTSPWSAAMASTAPAGISYGGGATKIGNTIYALSGGRSTYLMKFDTSLPTPAWTNFSSVARAWVTPPSGIADYGSFIQSDGSRYIYIGLNDRLVASGGRIMYRFDTTNDTWTRMADLPSNTNYFASAFYDTGNSRMYLAPGGGKQQLWYWEPTATNYVQSATWFSKIMDVTQVESWTGFSATTSGPGTVTFYTRSSANGKIWSNWQAVSSGNIQSPPNRYIQIKGVIQGDGTSQTSFSDLQFSYTQETAAPSITRFVAKSDSAGQTITDVGGQGQAMYYSYQHPYFEWDGSDGTGSGVDGYYVYFGTNSSADPATDGSWQTTTNYTGTIALDTNSTYYMRLKIKDKLGNLSSALQQFSYHYNYISPPVSSLATTQNDFLAGTNANLNITSEAGGPTGNGMTTLTPISAGAWSTGSFTALPDTVSGGAETIVKTDPYCGGEALYVLKGYNTTTAWRYCVATQRWDMTGAASNVAPLPSTPISYTVNSGSAMSWDGGDYIYVLRGNSTNSFLRYKISNNTWELLPDTQTVARGGADLIYTKNGILYFMASGTADFYEYRVNANSWTAKSSLPLTIDPNYGVSSGLWYDGGDTIYAYFGGSYFWSYGRRGFAKYSIAADAWSWLSTPPISYYYVENNLVSDGQGNLYIFGQDYAAAQQYSGYKYNIASNSWAPVPGIYAQGGNYANTGTRGTVTSDGKRYIYFIPSGGTTRRIIQYDTWDQRTVPAGYSPTSPLQYRWYYGNNFPYWQTSFNWLFGQATAAAYDGSDYIYMLAQNESNWSLFVRYSFSKKEYTYMQAPPYIGIGGAMRYAVNPADNQGYIYYVPGRGLQDFFRFNLITGSWERLANLPAISYRPGATTLIADAQGSLYMPRGYYDATFNKYDPTTNTWSAKASSPASIYNGSAVYDGSRYIYYLRSYSTNSFYRYDTQGNTWSSMANFSTTTDYGNAMVLHNGKIYANSGNTRATGNMFIYDITGNTWSAGTDSPEPFRYGGLMLKINNQFAIGIGGQDSPDFWQFNFPSATTAYRGLASHVSPTIPIDGLYDYAGIKADIDLPANTKIEFFTQTRDADSGWDGNAWIASDQVKYYYTGSTVSQMSVRANSTPKKYIRVKAVLYSFDSLYTPTLKSYSLDYYNDTYAPTNPTIAHVYSDSGKTTELDSGVWYNHPDVFIDWPDADEANGAYDGVAVGGQVGSGIKGYHAYFGSSQSATPYTTSPLITASEYQTHLTTTGTYYLRLQAEDMTGNYDHTVYAPFSYKFDITPPDNPAIMAAEPSGYTSTNKFTFSWPAAYDADSGIAQYCYRTGASTGPFATEQCIDKNDLTQENGLYVVKDVAAAYQQGVNVFYLRTKDAAGNYAASPYELSYYYSNEPPGKIASIEAKQFQANQNLFYFSWGLPVTYTGDPNQLIYCYSVNETPSALNTTCTGDRLTPYFKAATKQGANVFYVIAKDEAGNVNWANYGWKSFDANTVAPGIPLNLVVTDTSDQATNRWSLTLTWQKPTFEGSGIDHYIIERSADDHTYDEVGTTSNTAYVDMSLSDMSTEDRAKQYYYRIRAADNVANESGASATVAQSARGRYTAPPSMGTPTVVSGSDQASFTWETTSRASTSFVYYGTKPTELTQSKGSLDLVNTHVVSVYGLDPKTVYYYKIQSFDIDRSYDLSKAFSDIKSFRTADITRIEEVASSDITLSSTLIRWKTSVETKTKIEYGPTTDYGLSVDDSGFGMSHIMKLDTLNSGTLYHFRIIATAAQGSAVTSDDYQFTTVAYPVIDKILFQPLTDAETISVKVTWQTNVPTDSAVTYKTTNTSQETANTELTTDHSIILSDLAGNAEYTMMIKGRDKYGNQASGDVQTWKSQVDTRPPKISNIGVDVGMMGGVGNSKALVIVSWDTDEPSTTQVKYGLNADEKLDKELTPDTSLSTSHTVVIPNLDLSQIYKIQPISIDASGNKAVGEETAAITPYQESSLLDTITNILSNLFGHFGL